MMLISCRVEHHNLIYVFMEIFILMMILFGIVVSYYSDFGPSLLGILTRPHVMLLPINLSIDTNTSERRGPACDGPAARLIFHLTRLFVCILLIVIHLVSTSRQSHRSADASSTNSSALDVPSVSTSPSNSIESKSSRKSSEVSTSSSHSSVSLDHSDIAGRSRRRSRTSGHPPQPTLF